MLYNISKSKRNKNTILTDHSWLQIDHNGTRDVASISSFREESGERVVGLSKGFRWDAAIGLDAVLQAVQLPAGVTDLDTGLTNMNGDNFALKHVTGQLKCMNHTKKYIL